MPEGSVDLLFGVMERDRPTPQVESLLLQHVSDFMKVVIEED